MRCGDGSAAFEGDAWQLATYFHIGDTHFGILMLYSQKLLTKYSSV